VAEGIADTPEHVPEQLGACPDPFLPERLIPSESAVRRLLARVDGDAPSCYTRYLGSTHTSQQGGSGRLISVPTDQIRPLPPRLSLRRAVLAERCLWCCTPRPEYRRHAPEGRFGHYLMLAGALGGSRCAAPARRYGEYESAIGAGQVHLLFDRPAEGWTG
jgi:hypothetical protein